MDEPSGIDQVEEKHDAVEAGPSDAQAATRIRNQRYRLSGFGTQEFGLQGQPPIIGAYEGHEMLDVSEPTFLHTTWKTKNLRHGGNDMHSYALVWNGKKDILYTWGVNDNFVLARDTGPQQQLSDFHKLDYMGMPGPAQFNVKPKPKRIDAVTMSSHSMVVLSDEGRLFLSGMFLDANQNSLLKLPIRKLVELDLFESRVVSITSISSAVLVLLDNRKLYMFGLNMRDQGPYVYDRDTDTGTYDEPSEVPSAEQLKLTPVADRIASVWAGYYSTFVIRDDGQLYSRGLNRSGNLGYETPQPVMENLEEGVEPPMFEDHFKPVPLLAGVKPIRVVCGQDHSILLAERDGMIIVLTCGSNVNGQTGQPNREGMAKGGPNVLVFTELVFFTSLAHNKEPVVSIHAGDNTSWAITVSGALYGWGYNGSINLGTGDTEDRLIPTRINNGSLENKCVAWVHAGSQFTLVSTREKGFARALTSAEQKATKDARNGKVVSYQKKNQSLRLLIATQKPADYVAPGSKRSRLH